MNPKRRAIWIALGLALAAPLAPLLGGCDSILGIGDCTQIGCSDGIAVRFSGAVPDSVEVALRAMGEEERVRSCSATTAPCTSGMRFEDTTPEQVTLEVRWDGRSRVEVVQPEYSAVRPNGPSCEPTCMIATIELAF